MNRTEIKDLLPILQAFAEGKVIQMLDDRSIWTDLTEREGLPIGTLSEEPNSFRIKPEPKYRSFKNAEECWNEIQKHQPLGWVKSKNNYLYSLITTITTNEEEEIYLNGIGVYSLDEVTKQYIFADGTPFGILEEE